MEDLFFERMAKDARRHSDQEAMLNPNRASLAAGTPYRNKCAAFALEVEHPEQIFPASRYIHRTQEKVWKKFLEYTDKKIAVRVLLVVWPWGKRDQAQETELQTFRP